MAPLEDQELIANPVPTADPEAQPLMIGCEFKQAGDEEDNNEEGEEENDDEGDEEEENVENDEDIDDDNADDNDIIVENVSNVFLWN
ncbi:hypothetical protein GGR56DRAFT_675428 [Xylariaceae sp. FL0804]|nr:hypothetical protein GGR56DRAFT_675428 [Xylariaceae sp. FL0804]